MAKVISPKMKCANAGKLDTALSFYMFKIATFHWVFEFCVEKKGLTVLVFHKL